MCERYVENVRRILVDEEQREGWLRRLDRKRNRGQEEEETNKHISEESEEDGEQIKGGKQSRIGRTL